MTRIDELERKLMKGQSRAERKVEKATDALIELLDYPEVLEKAGVAYEVQIVIDKLNSIGTSISMIS